MRQAQLGVPYVKGELRSHISFAALQRSGSGLRRGNDSPGQVKIVPSGQNPDTSRLRSNSSIMVNASNDMTTMPGAEENKGMVGRRMPVENTTYMYLIYI
jgi:hypothetical protein